MRLSQSQCAAIREAVLIRDPNAQILLFGSRADDRRRGGDIDLLVLSDRLGFEDVWPIRRDILDRIGWQKLDLIVEKSGKKHSAIARIALETGVRL